MAVSVKRNFHYYIEKNKNKCGGQPVIKGTRISVWSIIKWYKLGFSIEDILKEFSQLNPAQVYDAFSYYYDNQKEIEKEIITNEDEFNWAKLIANQKI